MTVKVLGVASGQQAANGAALMAELAQSPAAAGGVRFLMEPSHPLAALMPAAAVSAQAERLHVLQQCQALQAAGASRILVPCLAAQAVLALLQAELDVPLVSLAAALRDRLAGVAQPGDAIGVLATDDARDTGFFGDALGTNYRVVYLAPGGGGAGRQAEVRAIVRVGGIACRRPGPTMSW
ncbi:aspartate/glutamate racemase family protein [Cupriavidus sp. SK-4]|uniref:aspartate/glutamate racemase family protein n=1 Tax=Cupriavidus sp. SK-4 TaxID=574750 RepID=UPI0013773DF2|nr:aspartate/glutamate racemase family protein [Cupriavidus sp. SK-4]